VRKPPTKPPKIVWLRSCRTAEAHGRFHIAFHSQAKALRDCQLGKKQGCRGAQGDCPGPQEYVARGRLIWPETQGTTLPPTIPLTGRASPGEPIHKAWPLPEQLEPLRSALQTDGLGWNTVYFLILDSEPLAQLSYVGASVSTYTLRARLASHKNSQNPYRRWDRYAYLEAGEFYRPVEKALIRAFQPPGNVAHVGLGLTEADRAAMAWAGIGVQLKETEPWEAFGSYTPKSGQAVTSPDSQ